MCYPIPLLLVGQNTGDPSRAHFAVASLLCSTLDAFPVELFRILAISSNKMQASSSIMAFKRVTNSSLHFAIFHLAPIVEIA